MEPTTAGSTALARQLDRELRLVGEAILLVASRHSRRVTVGGLRLGDEILEPARRLARDAGVRLVPLWTSDDHHVDIRIEAPEP